MAAARLGAGVFDHRRAFPVRQRVEQPGLVARGLYRVGGDEFVGLHRSSSEIKGLRDTVLRDFPNAGLRSQAEI